MKKAPWAFYVGASITFLCMAVPNYSEIAWLGWVTAAVMSLYCAIFAWSLNQQLDAETKRVAEIHERHDKICQELADLGGIGPLWMASKAIVEAKHKAKRDQKEAESS